MNGPQIHQQRWQHALKAIAHRVEPLPMTRATGRVVRATGMVIEAVGL